MLRAIRPSQGPGRAAGVSAPIKQPSLPITGSTIILGPGPSMASPASPDSNSITTKPSSIASALFSVGQAPAAECLGILSHYRPLCAKSTPFRRRLSTCSSARNTKVWPKTRSIRSSSSCTASTSSFVASILTGGSSIRSHHIDLFTRQQASHNMGRIRRIHSILRGLFRYLFSLGRVDRDWAAAIVSPRRYRLDRTPRASVS